MSDSPSQTSSATSRSYRPALLVAFFACFLWLVLVFNGVFDRLALPLEVRILIGLFVPILVAVAILYRSGLFRERRRWDRMIRLFLFGAALLFFAFVLLSVAALFLFSIGGVIPN